MICEKCPALVCEGGEYSEVYCSIGADEEYGKDNGCTMHQSTVYKRVRDRDKALELQYQDCGEWFKEDHYKEIGIDVSNPSGSYILQAIHCIGLDREKPYKRHGKLFYKAYRNHYDAGGTDIAVWEILTDIGYAEKHRMYHLTDAGLRWLGRNLGITIKESN